MVIVTMNINPREEVVMLKPKSIILILIVIALSFLTACNSFNPGEPDSDPMEQQPVDPDPNSGEEVTSTATVEQMVTIYLVAIEDNGISGKKIGCDDSLVPVELSTSSNLAAPWNALSALLSLSETYFGESGLYNALHQSELAIQSYEINQGKAKVYLEGELMLGGVCDQPRVEEQIMTTILDSGQVKEVEVFINGTLLQDYLSLK
jgi:hypothetical protein